MHGCMDLLERVLMTQIGRYGSISETCGAAGGMDLAAAMSAKPLRIKIAERFRE
jgi:hypothetical protein